MEMKQVLKRRLMLMGKSSRFVKWKIFVQQTLDKKRPQDIF